MSRKRNKKRNPPRVHTDDRGRYIWETYFVDGKQKRRKIRDIDSDGHIIRDMDEWLLANASDDVLHGMERWDLIDQRMFAETETTEPPTTMKTSRRL
ncbi:MAG: hypothetical protein KDN05_20455, partial [Verrucomicrobiae bacterium]|nr:hypothetical protein [Verrucomicrobiae bacterium]